MGGPEGSKEAAEGGVPKRSRGWARRLKKTHIEMTKKLLVGNLPDSTARSTVESIFRVVGPVLSVNVVRNGFAFVEMTASDADKARVQLNGYRLNGKPVIIDEAHPVSSRP